MSFLTPFFLLGGLAIAAPIIYHLIRQTTRERKFFGSLMFLMPSPPRISTRHRLEHIVLLILRCLALLLLALGFARPFLTQTELVDPSAVQPRRMVLLLDRSASMRRDGLWPAAQERVEALLRTAGPVDQVAVYTFDRQAIPLVTFADWNQTDVGGRVAMAMGRVAGVAPGWGGTQLGNALISAAESIGETDGQPHPGPRQVYLIGDLQAGSRLDTLQAYEWPKGVELHVEAVKAGKPTNAALQLVAEAVDSTRAPDAPIRVRVVNAADSQREEFTLGWTRADDPATFVGATVPAYVSPGQARVFSVPLPADAVGTQLITLRGDDNEFDNTIAVIPPAQQRATVLWLGNDTAGDSSRPLFFLRRAYSDTPRVAVQVVARPAAEGVLLEELQSAHLVFVSDAVSPATATALRTSVLAGKTVVLAARNAAASGILSGLLDREGIAMAEARLPTYAMFSEIDFQHPLFAPFNDPRFSDFTKIHVWKHRKLDLTAIPDARILAKFDSGDPAVIEIPVGRGRVFVLTAGWQPEDSQLAISSKFVPLMWSWLELAGGVSNAATQFHVGDRIPLPAGAGATLVRLPDGTSVPLPTGAEDFGPSQMPGIYEFSGGARAVRVAVNLDVNEGRTAPLDTDELDRLGVPIVQEESLTVGPDGGTTLLQGMEAENRQKLWRWFIAATLAVLLVESALAGWAARRSATRTAEVAS